MKSAMKLRGRRKLHERRYALPCIVWQRWPPQWRSDCNCIKAFAATMHGNRQTSRHPISSSTFFIERLPYSRSSTLHQKVHIAYLLRKSRIFNPHIREYKHSATITIHTQQ
jgi:hypothetical protein